MKRAAITAVGHYTPSKILTNADLEKIVDTSHEWITTRTGIKERRIAGKNESTSDMAIKAVKEVLKMKNILPEDIDLIIVGTTTPDMISPSTASMVCRGLGIQKIFGFDINNACTSFLSALLVASKFIETGVYKKVIVVGADKISAFTDYTDRNTCVLFGDGAGAVLLEPCENELGIIDSEFFLDNSGIEHLNILGGGSRCPASFHSLIEGKHFVYQNGKVVFTNAIRGMTDATQIIMKRNSLSISDIGLCIPHQANLRIIKGITERLGLKAYQFFVNIEKYGNTVNATIPIALSEALQQNRIKKGDNIILTAFGGGFTCGSILIKWI